MASFTSSIGASIYEVLFVFYSYPNDDMEMVTFDRTVVLLAMLHDGNGKILVSIHDWLKHGFCNTRK